MSTIQYIQQLKMDNDVKAFIKNNKRIPETVTIPAIPSLISTAQIAFGGLINSVTDFITLMQKPECKYLFYDCMKYKNDPNECITAIKSTGINCADGVNLLIQMVAALNSMGYDYVLTILHVDCNNSKKVPDPTAGHFLALLIGGEFTEETEVDVAEALCGKKGIGNNMCTFGYNQDGIIGHTLC